MCASRALCVLNTHRIKANCILRASAPRRRMSIDACNLDNHPSAHLHNTHEHAFRPRAQRTRCCLMSSITLRVYRQLTHIAMRCRLRPSSRALSATAINARALSRGVLAGAGLPADVRLHGQQPHHPNSKRSAVGERGHRLSELVRVCKGPPARAARAARAAPVTDCKRRACNLGVRGMQRDVFVVSLANTLCAFSSHALGSLAHAFLRRWCLCRFACACDALSDRRGLFLRSTWYACKTDVAIAVHAAKLLPCQINRAAV